MPPDLARGRLLSQRGNHSCGVIFKNSCILLASLRWQQIDAGTHRHHVHMQMKNDLPACGLAELLNDDPFRIKRLHRRDGYPLGRPCHLREIIRRDIKDAACRGLWYTSV